MTALADKWAEKSPAVRAQARWRLTARPSQLPPPGDWNGWLLLAGRGYGKTRTAAEDLAYHLLTTPGMRAAVIAPTFADARDTCIEGESGLLACLPHEDVGDGWNRSMGELVLPRNGARVKLFSADKPDRLRGPQHHRLWFDELAAFTYPQDTFDLALMGLRLGEHPKWVATTTPRPTRLIRELVDRTDVTVTRGSTYDNARNLPAAALDQLRRRYEGTRLGRQELEGQILEDVEGALWARAWIDDHRLSDPPAWWFRKVMGLDPADGLTDGDEQALCIAGQGADWEFYVTRSEGTRDTPLSWLSYALRVARDEEVSGIVIEKNHGGEFLVGLLEEAIRATGIRVPYRIVTASQGKLTRAEPVAGLYEQRRVHHMGIFHELEDQMVTFTGQTNQRSPDRLDALVWAMADLMGLAREPDTGLRAAIPYTTTRPGPDGAVPYVDELDGAIAYR